MKIKTIIGKIEDGIGRAKCVFNKHTYTRMPWSDDIPHCIHCGEDDPDYPTMGQK